jgi:hypothetical protein
VSLPPQAAARRPPGPSRRSLRVALSLPASKPLPGTAVCCPVAALFAAIFLWEGSVFPSAKATKPSVSCPCPIRTAGTACASTASRSSNRWCC